MAVVNIPNVGSVNFPDSMSQDDILSAIENDILPNYAGTTAAPQNAGQAPVAAAPEPAAPVVEEATPAPATPAPVTAQVPQDSPPYDPAYAELSVYEPSFIDRLGRMLGLGGNRDAASVELAARRIAKAQGITVGEVYKQAGGSRDIFNPEGRATLPAIGEASAVAGESLQDVPISFANTALRAIRGGDITGGEDSFLDYAIKKTTAPDRKVDKNYEDLGGLGKSLGYSFATMGASILATVGAGLVTANPLVAGAAAMGTSGTVSYRASKDEFLDRVRDNLDAKIKQVYDRPMTKEEWQSVRGDFESAASKYGAWEAIPEAVGNMFMVKAFSAPAKGMTKPMLNKLVERTAALGVENIGETATGFGGRKAEIEAGLSNEELSIKDAFKQQFLSTALLGGTMAAGAKGSQMATSFYQKYVEPKVNPESALGRAIMDDLNSVVADPESARQQAVDALDPNQKVAPTSMEDMAGARTTPPVAPVTPNAEPPEQEKPDLNSPVVATTRTEVGGKESIKTTRADGSVDVDGVLVTPATKQTTPEQPTPPAQPAAKPVNYIDTETGEIVPSDQADPKVKYINQETGEVVPPTRVEPTIGSGGDDAVIQRRADELSRDLGLPKNIALSVAQREAAERGQNVERTPAKSVTGRIEPSLSVSEQGTATTEGVAPFDTTGLARPVEDTESPVGREEAEPTALSDIPTLTERAPVEQAQTKLAEAEIAVAEATTPEEKKDATKQRNVARQEVKQAQAAAPVAAAETPATKIWQPIASARLINAPFGVADVNGVHYEFGQYGGQKYEVDISTEEIGKNGVVRDNGDRRSNIMYPGGPVLPFVPPNVAPLLTKLSQTKVGDIATRDALMAQISEEFNKEVGQPVPAPATETPKTQAEINQERQAAQKAAATVETPAVETPAVETPAVETPAQVTGFKTSKGSEYVVDESGKTSRTKKSPGEGQGQTYAPHNAVYVDTAAQNAILEDMQGLFGVGGSIRIGYVANNAFNTVSDLNQLPNNVEPVVAVINKQTGQAVAVHKASTQPEIGLHPVEKLYNDDGTSSTHLGNDITEITKSPAATTTTTEAAKPKRGRPPKPKVEVAEPTAPKPKGRRKIERTPEEQIVYEEGRNKIRAEINKARRAVEGAIAKLEEKVDVDRFDTPAALETATDILRQERNQAVYLLSAIAINPMFRKVESSGVKAIQFLESDSVTAQERLVAAQRLKFEDARNNRKAQAQAAPDSRFAKLGKSGVNTKTNRELYKFSNAADAAAYIANTGTVFERALARRLLPFLTGVNLVIADTEENTIDSAKNVLGKNSATYFADTSFGEAFKMIVLRGENYGGTAAHGVNNVTFLHEALHAAVGAKIDQAMRFVKAGRVKDMPPKLFALINDLYGIMNRAQDNYDALKASGAPISEQLQHLFEGISIGTNIDEFVSYGLTDVELQKFLLGTPALAEKDRSIIDDIKNLFTKFVQTLRSAFDLGANHQSAFQDLIFATEGLLIEEENAPAEVEELRLAAKNLNASTAKVDKNLEQVKLSPDRGVVEKATEENIVKGHTYNNFNDLLQARLDAMGNGFITKTLATLQTADIIRWQGDAIPALKSIDTLVEKMAGSRMNMEQAFAKKADKFAAFIRKVGKKKILLSDAMHLARLNSVSPSLFADRADALATDKRMVQLDKLLANPTTPQEELSAITRKRTIREGQINQTFDAWENLSTLKGGQDMYRMVRQFYKDANVLTRTLLDERIERLNVKGSIDDPSTPKGKLMLAVRRMQEDSDFKGVDEYFPFMRYGDFWLRVNGPQGKEFYLFESGTKRNEFQKKRARQLGIDPNAESEIFDAGDDLTALRTKYSPESKMLADMFEIIDNEMDKPGVDKDALKDALYQTYLMTLPEESYRKQFLHAENVTGFSSDVFRNFTTSASRIASQSAKLAYGDQISAELQRARDTLTGMPISKKTKLELFVNEIGKRVEDELNPAPESKAVARINQFAYYSLLTGIASAITQTSALPMLVMPVLNQEYGYGSSAAKFAKYMALWKSVGVTQEGANGEVVYVAPTMGESSLVKSNPILQRAFQEAIDRGLTSQTNSSVLSNRNRTPDSAYANLPQAALRTTATVMSSLFTGAERMTREMTYLMTFELEYAKTKDFDASVQKAVDTVQELLGRYDAFNRPRIMRNALGRTVGQFKMYAVNITSFFVRNAYNMFAEAFKGNPKEAVAAMHRLTGVLTMAAVFGGVTAFPMYSLVTSTIDLVLNNLGDDDEEKKRRIAENPYTAFSSDLRFRYEFLPRLFGDIKLTGLDGKQRTLAAVLEKGAVSELGDFNIGSRTTYDGMWFRDAKPGNTTTETIINYLVANLGPAVSSGLSMTGAVDDFNNGKIARGFERISPALFKNFFTAARLAGEGAKTPAGDTVMTKDEFSSFNTVMQALGFQSTQLARYQENKYKLQQETVAANKTRSDILKKLDNAILDSDASDADVERVFNRIDKFNDRYIAMKHLRIAPDTIKQVLDKAKGKEKFMFRGMYIRKEDLPYLLELRDVTERPQ